MIDRNIKDTTQSDQDLISSIVRAMRSCYGDLDSPDYRSIASKISSEPHRDIINELGGLGATLEVTTDGNYDRATQIYLNKVGEELAVEFSFVGSFAVVRSLGNHPVWFTQGDVVQSDFIEKVINIVVHHGFTLLGHKVVRHSTPMRDLDTNSMLTVYEAIFFEGRVPD